MYAPNGGRSQDRCLNPIEVAVSGNLDPQIERIANAGVSRLNRSCHRKCSDRSVEVRWTTVGGQSLDLNRRAVGRDRRFFPFVSAEAITEW